MYVQKIDYPCLTDVLVALKIRLEAAEETSHMIDIDEAVYETIGSWDEYFEGDEEWFSEEDSDLKDSLRDQVLEFLEIS